METFKRCTKTFMADGKLRIRIPQILLPSAAKMLIGSSTCCGSEFASVDLGRSGVARQRAALPEDHGLCLSAVGEASG